MFRIAAALVLALALVSGVGAHTQLSSSMPVDGAVLHAPPEQVVLQFSEPVRLTALTIGKRGGDEKALGPLPTTASKDFALQAPDLDAGEYRVAWRALAADTHVVAGELTFTVSATPAPGSHPEHAQH